MVDELEFRETFPRKSSVTEADLRFENNFQFVCPFPRAKTLSPVKAVIKTATLKEKPP
jgi:hypothetical protein